MKQNPAGDASGTEKGNGDVRDSNRTRSYTCSSSIIVHVLVVRTSSLEPLDIPGAAYLVPRTGTCKHPTESYGGLSRA